MHTDATHRRSDHVRRHTDNAYVLSRKKTSGGQHESFVILVECTDARMHPHKMYLDQRAIWEHASCDNPCEAIFWCVSLVGYGCQEERVPRRGVHVGTPVGRVTDSFPPDGSVVGPLSRPSSSVSPSLAVLGMGPDVGRDIMYVMGPEMGPPVTPIPRILLGEYKEGSLSLTSYKHRYPEKQTNTLIQYGRLRSLLGLR